MPNGPGQLRQAAAIPCRNGQVCLVTSRSGKHRVVPKGNIELGKSAGEIALQEAWEEAGLVGLLQEVPLGSYLYEKDGMLCHVIVYLLNVTAIEDTYPETGLRQRVWLPISQAQSRVVDDAGLRDILRSVLISRTS